MKSFTVRDINSLLCASFSASEECRNKPDAIFKQNLAGVRGAHTATMWLQTSADTYRLLFRQLFVFLSELQKLSIVTC